MSRIRFRAIYREPLDVRRYARAVIELVLHQQQSKPEPATERPADDRREGDDAA